MNSRMDKYQEGNVVVKERTAKNKKLYEELNDIDIDYIDIDMNLDNAFEIPKEKQYKSREEFHRLKEINSVFSEEEKTKEIIKEEIEDTPRSYDINEILQKARDARDISDKKKRIISTEYNILTKLDIEKISAKEDFNKDNLRKLIDEIYKNETSTKKSDNDLFHDLIEDNKKVKKEQKEEQKEEKQEEQEEEKLPIAIKVDINESLEEKKIEENNLKIKKQTRYSALEDEDDDLEDEDEDLEDDFDLDDTKDKVVIAVVIIVLVLLLVGVFLLLKYFDLL